MKFREVEGVFYMPNFQKLKTKTKTKWLPNKVQIVNKWGSGAYIISGFNNN